MFHTEYLILLCMIGFIDGVVKATIRDTVIVEVHGIGYRVRTPTTTLAKTHEGDSLSLWTYLSVRENALDLFGFEDRDELRWFELLLSVSGIGPRSALSVLNSADSATLESAVAGGDASILVRAFGIGRKTAEKIVLELKEKIVSVEGGATALGSDGDVVAALMSLGYSAREARDLARAVSQELEGTENRIREALRIASGTK